MKFAALPLLLLVAGCGSANEPAKNEIRVDLNGLEHVTGMERCEHGQDYPGCVDLFAPEKLSGVWEVGFEESSFEPTSPKFGAGEGIWLEVSPALEKRYYDGVWSRRFAVAFIGRRSYEGRYGHKGCCRDLVVMDKLISIRELPTTTRNHTPPPPDLYGDKKG